MDGLGCAFYIEFGVFLQDIAMKKLTRYSKLDVMKDEEAKIRAELAKSTSTRHSAFSPSTMSDVSVTLDKVNEDEDTEVGVAGGELSMETSSGVPAWLLKLVQSERFDNFFTAVVIYNSLTMCIYHHDIDPTLLRFLNVSDLIIVFIFTFEFIVKVVALGWREYIHSSSNQFDFFLVLCGLIEVYEFVAGDQTASFMQVLRASRTFRVFKLAKRWDSLQSFIMSLLKAAKSLGPFMCLVVLMVMVSALLGRSLFAGQIAARLNYDTLFWSTVTTFQLLSGENWNDTMYSAVEASGSIAVLYFLVIYIVGNLIVINIIIAVLIDNCHVRRPRGVC
jgi:voltage-gated sodium channel